MIIERPNNYPHMIVLIPITPLKPIYKKTNKAARKQPGPCFRNKTLRFGTIKIGF